MLHEDILQTMGVTLLRPRFVFDNAAAEDLTAYVKPEAESPAQTEQVTNNNDYRSQLLADMGQLKSSAANKKQVDQTLRFRYRLVRMDNCLAVLEQKEQHWPIEKQVLSFLRDVYFALYGKLPNQWQQALFEWPPSQHYPLAGQLEQAQQTLHSFVKQMLQGQSQVDVLAWGNTAAMLQSEKLAAGDVKQLSIGRLLALDTVTSYWQLADSKRLLWQQLQVLR